MRRTRSTPKNCAGAPAGLFLYTIISYNIVKLLFFCAPQSICGTPHTACRAKILIADDDKNICELLRLYLAKEGYETVIANDGEAAVAAFEKEKPNMVLLDVMMPKMDGWEVCRRIRAADNTPVIMLTAKGETFDKVLGLELGADDYVVKPCCAAARPPRPSRTASSAMISSRWT